MDLGFRMVVRLLEIARNHSSPVLIREKITRERYVDRCASSRSRFVLRERRDRFPLNDHPR